MKPALLLVFLLFQAGERVAVNTSLDRTAAWIGDHVKYSVELTCAPDVDILVDDLAKDRLQVDGLDVLSSNVEKKRDGRYSVTYEVAPYGIDKALLKIQEVTVRYFRKGSSTPEGEIKIPPATIAFRSTLLDGQESYPIRDARREPEAAGTQWYSTAGLLLMAGCIAAFGFILFTTFRTRLPSQVALRKRTPLTRGNEWLEKLKHADSSTEATRREAFTSLDSVIRGRLEDLFEIPARSLTPGEIEDRLAKSGNGLSVSSVAVILRDCEHARYCPDDLIPSSEDWQSTLAEAGRVFK